jgi:hypothetical protein
MNLGLLDLPGPLFDLVDAAFVWLRLPVLVRVVVYAGACATACMYLYRKFSDQPALLRLRDAIRQAQQSLTAEQDDFANLYPLIRDNLRLSLRQLRLTLVPAALSSLPLLVALPWFSNRFDLAPIGTDASRTVCVEPVYAALSLHWTNAQTSPASAAGCWQVQPAGGDDAMLVQQDGQAVFTLHTQPHSNVIAKHTWLNWFVANPDGYVPDDASIEQVHVITPRLELVTAGPEWMRSWEFACFAMLILVSLLLRRHWRLH